MKSPNPGSTVVAKAYATGLCAFPIVHLVVAVLAALAPLASASADDESDNPSVTPYRPSVSTPAQLSAPRWLEGEFGAQRLKGPDFARRDSVPYTFKYAFTPDWGLRLGGDGYVHSRDRDAIGGAQSITGWGDTAIVVKRRFGIDDASAFGLEAGVNLPTAKTGLGIDKPDYSLNGIYSTDLAEWHADFNLAATRIGRIDVSEGRWQTTWAAALSHPLTGQWGVVGEFSGTVQRGASSTSQFLAAASYSLSKRAVVDFGAAAGLNRASPRWAAFAGMTVLIGKLR